MVRSLADRTFQPRCDVILLQDYVKDLWAHFLSGMLDHDQRDYWAVVPDGVDARDSEQVRQDNERWVKVRRKETVSQSPDF